MRIKINAKTGELRHDGVTHKVDMRKIKGSDRVTVIAMMKQRLFASEQSA